MVMRIAGQAARKRHFRTISALVAGCGSWTHPPRLCKRDAKLSKLSSICRLKRSAAPIVEPSASGIEVEIAELPKFGTTSLLTPPQDCRFLGALSVGSIERLGILRCPKPWGYDLGRG